MEAINFSVRMENGLLCMWFYAAKGSDFYRIEVDPKDGADWAQQVQAVVRDGNERHEKTVERLVK